MQHSENTVHFIGIGGSGMSPLAEIALKKGFTVTGSDTNRSEVTEQLEKLGAKVFIGHSPENVPNDSKVVFSSAIAADNPEIESAKERNTDIYHRSDFLADLMKGKKCRAGQKYSRDK